MPRLRPASITVMSALTCACNSVLLGGAPPKPAPPDVPTGRESLRNGASSTVFVAQRTKDDIELHAHDLAAAEDGMARRCPDGYVVSFVGSAPSETCSAPRGLYSSRRTGQQYAGPTSREDEAPRSFPRCRAQDDVLVRYRCVVRGPRADKDAKPGEGARSP